MSVFWWGLFFLNNNYRKTNFFTLKQAYMVQMILAEPPPTWWAHVLVQRRPVCSLKYLPILQFDCFQLLLSSSPAASARGWQVKRLTKSDYFHSFILQIVPEHRTQMSTHLSMKGQRKFPEREGGQEKGGPRESGDSHPEITAGLAEVTDQ